MTVSLERPNRTPQGPEQASSRGITGRRVLGWLSPANIGAIYLWIIIIVFFSIAEPVGFVQTATATTVLNQYAISGMIALATVIPLAAGVFDVSVAYTMGLSGALAARLLRDTDLPIWWVVILCIGIGGLVGLANAFIVVVLKVNPIIGTLGSGFIVFAIAAGIDESQAISENVGGEFQDKVASQAIFSITQPVWYMLIIMLLLGFLMEQTATGRRWYALGYDFETTRLAGVRVRSLRTSALVLSGSLAAFTGVVYTARIGAHSPGDGPQYLLPAFAAVFLGATQFRGGRFNVWGTIVATLMLGTGAYGLLVWGAPPWTIDVFQGVALIGAVAISSVGLGKGWLKYANVRALAGRKRDATTAVSEDPPPST